MSFGSSYSQMMDDREVINNSYDILAGHLPQNYDEMIIVLADRTTVSDYLLYSLGIRPVEELTDIVTKIMSGEKVELSNTPKDLTYEELLNTELKLIMPADFYKYNEKYNIYEDMSQNEEFMANLYENSINLKIVGIVTAKEGVNSNALNPGVSYTKDLIEYIINYSAETEIVKKQLANEEVDVLSNTRFDAPKGNLDLDFQDLISIDTNKLSSAFNMKIDQKDLENKTKGYMGEIVNSISTDTAPVKNDLINSFEELQKGMFDSIPEEIEIENVDSLVDTYLSTKEADDIFKKLETKYYVLKDTLKKVYSGLLKSLLQLYINAYTQIKNLSNELEQGETINYKEIAEALVQGDMSKIPEEYQKMLEENEGDVQAVISKIQELEKEHSNQNAQNNSIKIKIDKEILNKVLSSYNDSTAIENTFDTMAKGMLEAVIKKSVMQKIAELTNTLTNSLASGFNVDQDKIASAFKMKLTEEEITRIVTAMVSKTQANAKTNLISLGYQDKEEPTYISFYFKSFDGKEHFKEFINNYNEKVKANGENDKEINYTDTTGILMGSVKTIVNAVTYVLIAFISISLVVSSIMIGIITYISVYERTKEIGILRAIGASKRNISSIFNSETFIIGLLSGGIGIGVTYFAIPIINKILHHFTGKIPLNVILYSKNAIILVILSVVLTLIGGLIPAKAASKKDPVIALRTE